MRSIRASMRLGTGLECAEIELKFVPRADSMVPGCSDFARNPGLVGSVPSSISALTALTMLCASPAPLAAEPVCAGGRLGLGGMRVPPRA